MGLHVHHPKRDGLILQVRATEAKGTRDIVVQKYRATGVVILKNIAARESGGSIGAEFNPAIRQGEHRRSRILAECPVIRDADRAAAHADRLVQIVRRILQPQCGRDQRPQLDEAIVRIFRAGDEAGDDPITVPAKIIALRGADLQLSGNGGRPIGGPDATFREGGPEDQAAGEGVVAYADQAPAVINRGGTVARNRDLSINRDARLGGRQRKVRIHNPLKQQRPTGEAWIARLGPACHGNRRGPETKLTRIRDH